jgi:centrin-1
MSRKVETKKSSNPEVKLKLTETEIDEIRQAFYLFDHTGSGQVDPQEMIEAFKALGWDNKNPAIFKLICSFAKNKEVINRGGLEFDTLLNTIQDELCDKSSRAGVKKIFELFTDERNPNIITIDGLRRVCREIGEPMSLEEIKELVERASSNGTDLTFEEFYWVLTLNDTG